MVLWHCCTFASSSDESAKAKPKKKKEELADGTKGVEGSNASVTNGAQKTDSDSAAAATADKSGENSASNTSTTGGETLPPFNVLSSFQNSQSPTSVATPLPSAANVVDLTEGDDVLAELGQIGRSGRKSSRPSTPVKKMLSLGEQKFLTINLLLGYDLLNLI